MSKSRIVIVRMGGGYLWAIFPDRQEHIYARDEREMNGWMKVRGIPVPIPFPARKKAT
jgi:hypothetical protein